MSFWNPLTCITGCLVVYSVGEFLSKKTKGAVSSLLFVPHRVLERPAAQGHYHPVRSGGGYGEFWYGIHDYQYRYAD